MNISSIITEGVEVVFDNTRSIFNDGETITRTVGTNNYEYAVWGKGQYRIEVVSSLPTNKDSNTLYFVTS